MHRYHPAVDNEAVVSLRVMELVPADFEGDDPEAVIFDHCDRCAEHAEHPGVSLDHANQARLLHRGLDHLAGRDHFRSDNERKAWDNL